MQAIFQPWRLTEEQKQELGLHGNEWVEQPLKRIEFHIGRSGGRGRGGSKGGKTVVTRGGGRGGYRGRGTGDKRRGQGRRGAMDRVNGGESENRGGNETGN